MRGAWHLASFPLSAQGLTSTLQFIHDEKSAYVKSFQNYFQGGTALITMATCKELVHPTSNESSNGHLRFGLAKRHTRKLPWVKIMAVLFSLLLFWQLAGTCLYFIRGLECFGEKNSTFLCERNAAFPYSEDTELTWLVSQSILVVIIIVALQKVPAFLGYRAIFHQLKLRPSFWTLVLLLAIALARYGMVLAMAPKSLLTLSIIIGFAVCSILTTVVACVLNCTQLNLLKRQYPRYVFVLFKLTLLVLFLVHVTNFIISLIAFSLRVHDVHEGLIPENSSNFEVVHTFLSDFGVASFRFKITSFFWHKMIADHKSVL